jgi:hypothetical protein
MKNIYTKIYFGMIILIFIVSILPNSSALVQFWQKKSDKGNGTIQDWLVVCYTKGVDDFIKSNNAFEGYVWYSVYIQKWNNDNPDYQFEYCNLTIEQSTAVTNYSEVYSINYTDADADVINAKYFVQLPDRSCATAYVRCKYEPFANRSGLDIPVNLNFVTPSWECKACQFYEWSLIEGDVVKAQEIGENVVQVSSYIKKLFLLNFEIWLALFWIFLILMIFVAIGMIFLLIYWLYLLMKRWIK